jgi:hypothetical protein
LFPGRKLDLAILNRADPLFLKQVTDNCRLLHGAQAELRRLKLSAVKRYHDHRKYLDLVHDYDEIDPRRVHEGLLAAVRDIPEYLRHVHTYVEAAS